MAAVILGVLLFQGFEGQRSVLFAVQGVVGLASIGAVALSLLSIVRRVRKAPSVDLPPALLIALDSVLAIGVMTVVDASTSPLAWVALITPVLETAVVYSISRAAFTWSGVTIAFLAVRLATSSSDDATAQTLFLSVQQVLAALYISGPAVLLADSAQGRIVELANQRRKADETSHRLRQIVHGAQEMSGHRSPDEILTVACESAASIGFVQADMVVRNEEGDPFVHSVQANGTAASFPAHILTDRAEGKIESIDSDDPVVGDTLRLAQVRRGHAIEVSTTDDDQAPQAVLRVWSSSDVESTHDLEILTLLGAHVREAYRTAQLFDEAQIHTDQLRHEVRHDSLTGLANRAFVRETLRNLIEREIPVALLFIDLDRFKAVNDTLGHHAGDDVLREVASRLRQTVREGALAGRMGGDEFAVLMPLTAFDNQESVVELGDQIVHAMGAPINVAGTMAQLGASVGIALHQAGMSLDQLFTVADETMYEAKRGGGGTSIGGTSQDSLADRNAS